MLALDRNALICDMAETYGIFDINRVPVTLLSTLAAGLGENSRIKLKQNGLKAPWNTILLAAIVDMLSGEKDDSKRLAPGFFISEKEENKDFAVFDSPDAFDRERARILGGQ